MKSWKSIAIVVLLGVLIAGLSLPLLADEDKDKDEHEDRKTSVEKKVMDALKDKVKVSLDEIQVEYKVLEGEWASFVYDMKVGVPQINSRYQL